MLSVGSLRSLGITPVHRYYGALRHPLVVDPFPFRLWGLPCSGDFSPGRGGLLQFPVCPCHHAIAVTPSKCPAVSASVLREPFSARHAAFDRSIAVSAFEPVSFRGTIGIHSRYGLVTHSPSQGGLCQWASGHWFPAVLPFMLQGSSSSPGRTDSY